MSLILVVESEGRHAERVRDGLGSDGWQVEVVASCEAAVAAVADRAPQLVLINAELPGAPEMLRNLSRAHGGPGSIALLPEVVGRELGPLEADESLIKPFSEKDLRQLARRVVASARAPRKSEDRARSEAAHFAGAVRRPVGRSGERGRGRRVRVRPAADPGDPSDHSDPSARGPSGRAELPGGRRRSAVAGDGTAPRAHSFGDDEGRAGRGAGGQEGFDQDRRHAVGNTVRPGHAEAVRETSGSGSARGNAGGERAGATTRRSRRSRQRGRAGRRRHAGDSGRRPDAARRQAGARTAGRAGSSRPSSPVVPVSRSLRSLRSRRSQPRQLRPARRPSPPPRRASRAGKSISPSSTSSPSRAPGRAVRRRGPQRPKRPSRPRRFRSSPPSCSRRRARSGSTRCSNGSRSAAWPKSGRRA